MTDTQIKAEIEKLILGCKGEIPKMIKVIEEMKETNPERRLFLDPVQAGLKRAIGQVS